MAIRSGMSAARAGTLARVKPPLASITVGASQVPWSVTTS